MCTIAAILPSPNAVGTLSRGIYQWLVNRLKVALNYKLLNYKLFIQALTFES